MEHSNKIIPSEKYRSGLLKVSLSAASVGVGKPVTTGLCS